MKVLIATEEGVFALAEEGQAEKETGPESAAFVSAGPDAAYAVTVAGALWRRDEGGWDLINDEPVNEAVWSFAADPQVAGLVYLGVHTAALHRSTDGGATWKACEGIKDIPGHDGWSFPAPPHVPHVRSIAPDPLVAGGVYIGVEEGGVYRSIDEGETWESLNEGLYWDVHTILPTTEPGLLYATTGDGFYRSEDAGQHWSHLMAGLDRGYTVPCVALASDLEVLYTAAATGSPPSWRHNNRGALAAMYRSDDGGHNWSRLERGLPETFHPMIRSINVVGESDVYAAAGNNVYASKDRGESWVVAATGLPNIRALAVI